MPRQHRMMVFLPDDLLADIEDHRRDYPDRPARTEAIRRLIRVGLAPVRTAKREAEMRERIAELEDDKRGLQAQITALYERGLDLP